MERVAKILVWIISNTRRLEDEKRYKQTGAIGEQLEILPSESGDSKQALSSTGEGGQRTGSGEEAKSSENKVASSAIKKGTKDIIKVKKNSNGSYSLYYGKTVLRDNIESADKAEFIKDYLENNVRNVARESEKEYIESKLLELHPEYKNNREALKLAAEAISEVEKIEGNNTGGQSDVPFERGEASKSAMGEQRDTGILPAGGTVGGPRTLGKGISTELINKGYIDFRGREVKSVEDIAVLSQIFRAPRFETFRIIFTKDYKSLELSYHGMTFKVHEEERVLKRASGGRPCKNELLQTETVCRIDANVRRILHLAGFDEGIYTQVKVAG